MHKRYLVTGKRQYRWHEPGSTFEAQLDPEAEQRAVARGAIQVLEVVLPSLQDGSYEFPHDWPNGVGESGEHGLVKELEEERR